MNYQDKSHALQINSISLKIHNPKFTHATRSDNNSEGTNEEFTYNFRFVSSDAPKLITFKIWHLEL